MVDRASSLKPFQQVWPRHPCGSGIATAQRHGDDAVAWPELSDSSRGCEPRRNRDRARSPLGAEVWRLVDPSAEFAQDQHSSPARPDRAGDAEAGTSRRARSRSSSDREEIGALKLAPARSRERQRRGVCWPAEVGRPGKRLCTRTVGTSVAPEFVPKRNSERSGSHGLRPYDAVGLEIGEAQVPWCDQRDTRLAMRRNSGWLPTSQFCPFRYSGKALSCPSGKRLLGCIWTCNDGSASRTPRSRRPHLRRHGRARPEPDPDFNPASGNSGDRICGIVAIVDIACAVVPRHMASHPE